MADVWYLIAVPRLSHAYDVYVYMHPPFISIRIIYRRINAYYPLHQFGQMFSSTTCWSLCKYSTLTIR